MSVTPEPEKNKIRACDQSHLEIIIRVRQLFEKERKEHREIDLNSVQEGTAAATGVNRNKFAKIQTIEDVLNREKKPGVPVPTPNDPVIQTNFSTIRQVVHETYLELKQVPTLDFILEQVNQEKVKDFDNFNLFTGDEIPHPHSKIWIWGRTSLYRLMKSIGFIYGEKYLTASTQKGEKTSRPCEKII